VSIVSLLVKADVRLSAFCRDGNCPGRFSNNVVFRKVGGCVEEGGGSPLCL
jgi:hypothetical protein